MQNNKPISHNNYNRPIYHSVTDYFKDNIGKLSEDEFARSSYLLIHTTCFNIRAKGTMITKFKERWRNTFSNILDSKSLAYITVLNPIHMHESIIMAIKNQCLIENPKCLTKGIVSLEFDLWMIEKYESNKAIDVNEFKVYITDKYNIKYALDDFIKVNLHGITQYNLLAKELVVYKKKIQEYLNLLLTTNQNTINTNLLHKSHSHLNKIDTLELGKLKTNAVSIEETPKQDNSLENTPEKSISSNEYSLIFKEKENQIQKLEESLRQTKIQLEELRNYAARRYNDGMRDLFIALNSPSYSRVIDSLYLYSKNEDIDSNLKSYLENFFDILEDYSIVPIQTSNELNINIETLLRDFKLEVDRDKVNVEKLVLKYPGWRFQGKILEKPELTQEVK